MKSAALADISAYRRTYAAGVAARFSLVALTVIGAAMVAVPAWRGWGMGLVLVSTVAYVVLSHRALRVSRDALEAPDHIARGDTEEAERVIRDALRRFSIFPAHRLVELHHLAVLRHQQKRFAEAAELASAVLQSGTSRLGREAAAAVRTGSALVRLESLLELGDLRSAFAQLQALGATTLPLAESVRLLSARTKYEAAVGAWGHLLHDLPGKTALADLMPAGPYATVHAIWASAARRGGRADLARWLAARAVSVAPDLDELCRTTPDIADLLREEAATTAAVRAPSPNWDH